MNKIVSSRLARIGSHEITVADDQPTFWDKVASGRWEPGTLALLARHMTPATTFLDLGAWVGPTTLAAAAAGARCIAVEADPSALDQLQRNLAANPTLAPRVSVIPRAVSPTTDPVRLGARRKPGDSMSSILLAGASASSWEAQAITPDELAEIVGDAERLFIKIDIEGAEFALLPALQPLLAKADAVLLSLHPTLLDPEDARRTLESALEAFTGWSAEMVTGEEALRATPSADAIAHGLQSAEWLFSRPDA